MTARDDLLAAFVDAMQDSNWHMTADEDHAKATSMIDAAIAEATSELQAKRQEEWDNASEMLRDGVKSIAHWQEQVRRVRALHVPARGGRSGYQPDDDDTPGAYGHISSACEECGSQDLAVRWPCPTIQALETT